MANLFIGSLAYATTDDSLKAYFEQIGAVKSAHVITDRETNRSKGFGFVEMSSGTEAQAAITALNGKDNGGRQLTVNEARPKAERGSGGGYRSSGGGSRQNRW